MISEPELDGVPEQPAGQLVAEQQDRPRRPRPSPVWLLAGAVAASALWAGGLYLVREPDRPGPPIPYARPTSLCDKAKTAALTRITGDLRPQRRENERLHEAVDLSWCGLGTAADGRQEASGRPYLSYDVTVTVELHKKADPEPEFEAGLHLAPYEGHASHEVSEVPGLGERALMYGSGPRQGPRLRVLDGGAVITLETNWSMSGNDWPEGGEVPPEPDESALQAAMIEDMRALLTALRG
ncbi:hypothetical protein [Streptomyces sp. NPDC048603]|uniref:hypothetical protein n=1 Tax=Streptomyces sp. NPDC048603 TaxID=3365577 RepID=UPI003716D473